MVLGCADSMKLAALEDPEGDRVEADLPPVVDAHVHLFPDRMFEAIWAWFDAHAWPVRKKLKTPEVISFLLSRGVDHIVALHYAHRPGMARALNAYMTEVTRDNPRVTGLATVMPGEPDAPAILAEAFLAGLSGVKLHCHVQAFAPDAPEVGEIYDACASRGMPIVLHAGREPRSDAYRVDTHALCSVDRVERVLRDHPRLRLCVPHLGADEFEGYLRLVERYDNLWLDTTMVFAGFFPGREPPRPFDARPDRIMYGTDFPNIPYAWDRELVRIGAMDLGEDVLADLLGRTARRFFRIGDPPLVSPPSA